MKIAIIGAGISGLATAYWLRQQHDVTLYEAGSHLGGHANTVDVQLDGESHAIDTGFIVFNDWTYPEFTRLMSELDVASQPTSMSFSLRCDRTGMEYNGTSLNGLFSQRKNLINPRLWRMLYDVIRFNVIGKKFLSRSRDDSLDDEITIAEFMNKHKFSQSFKQWYLFPMGSAIWSCPTHSFEHFPIRFVFEFYNNHGLMNLVNRPTWRFIEGGARTYVNAIARKLTGNIFLNTPIESVTRKAESVEVKARDQKLAEFDHVVFACHSDQALRILTDPSPTEKLLLSGFPYEKNIATLHTDQSLLPRSKRAFASWNYLISDDHQNGVNSVPKATVTYNMNILQQIQSKHVFCVSLNCEDRIDPQSIIATFRYEHPVFTAQRAGLQARHHELINHNRTSYAGAYWRNGFHEDGVVSAKAVCNELIRMPAQPSTVKNSLQLTSYSNSDV